MLGTFLVNSVPTTVLFDSGTSYSFVTEAFLTKGALEGNFMHKPMVVQIPGSQARSQLSCKDTSVDIQGVEFPADLIILWTQGIDVILSMDWLSRYHSRIDCARRAVAITSDKGIEVEYISVLILNQSCCHKGIARLSLDEIRVVHRFSNVFLEELPGMPPDQDIEFVIELIPGTTPISQRPYRMNPEELAKLNK